MSSTTTKLLRPTHTGRWLWSDREDMSVATVVEVEESPNGRFCRELKMGGVQFTSYDDWWGFWSPKLS